MYSQIAVVISVIAVYGVLVLCGGITWRLKPEITEEYLEKKTK